MSENNPRSGTSLNSKNSAPEVTIQEQVACAEREVRMRARVYPRWVQQGRMSPAKMKAETAAMEAIVKTLKEIEEERFPKLI